MDSGARDLLTRGVAAAKAGDKDEAIFYLEWVLRSESSHSQKIRAWEYLAEVYDDPKKQRDCLEEIILREPGNTVARRGLAILNGDLQAAEVIDATHQARQQASQPQHADLETAMHGPDQPQGEETTAKRFICQSCGGPLSYKADGRELRCDYCDRELSLYQAIQEGAMVEEKDFAVALATAKGHTAPVEMQALTCQGCSAPFILNADVLSITCPYCNSAHVIEERETRQLIPPEAVIPFTVTEKQAKAVYYNWLKKKKLFGEVQVSAPKGFYLPVWTFDIAGSVTGWARGYGKGAKGLQMPAQQVERAVFYNDIPVAATRRLKKRLAEEIHNFNQSELQPYAPGYLADWPAATYQVNAADASLVARKYAWEDVQSVVAPQLRDQVSGPFGSSADVEMNLSSANMYVEVFKLILVPLWLMHYRHKEHQNRVFDVIVNGQNAHVRGETPHSGLRRFFNRVLGLD